MKLICFWSFNEPEIHIMRMICARPCAWYLFGPAQSHQMMGINSISTLFCMINHFCHYTWRFYCFRRCWASLSALLSSFAESVARFYYWKWSGPRCILGLADSQKPSNIAHDTRTILTKHGIQIIILGLWPRAAGKRKEKLGFNKYWLYLPIQHIALGYPLHRPLFVIPFFYLHSARELFCRGYLLQITMATMFLCVNMHYKTTTWFIDFSLLWLLEANNSMRHGVSWKTTKGWGAARCALVGQQSFWVLTLEMYSIRILYIYMDHTSIGPVRRCKPACVCASSAVAHKEAINSGWH